MAEYDDPFVYKALFGLPVVTSKWMPDTMIVMGNRGGKTLAQEGWEYAQKMADRQKREEAMPTTDNYYLLSNNTTTIATTWYPDTNSNILYSQPYRVVSDPLAFRGINELRGEMEGVAKQETPEAWLRRRVKEICWVPA